MPRITPAMESPPRPKRSGSKLLSEDLSKDELLRRLKNIDQELSDAAQGENLEYFHGIAAFLPRKFIVKHPDSDVRFYASCAFANILRIYAPDAPYDTQQLWSIFDLIISQLEGLKNATAEKGKSYDKLFHLLEILAMVKTLILCVQLDFNDLVLKVFKVIFDCVRQKHSMKVKNFMLDIMSSLLSEAESIPQELLDVILQYVVNPKKASNRAAYELACSLIERTAASIEPHIHQFFNDALFFEKVSESSLRDSLYDVVYELYKICPSVLLSVLPQLEFKLKSVDEHERLRVVALVGKMFSDEESTLAQSHKPLWQCFLGRFVDINSDVRVECTKRSKDFFLHHPELVREISEKLLERQRDTDDKVRMEVVTTICEAASENVENIPQKLFDVLTERLRDRKMHIRTDTMMSLGRLYKKISASDATNACKKRVSWIPTKILHCYYQTSPEDRLQVERVFLGCLVPISLPSKERMKRLVSVYETLDEAAVKAFTHMLKSQNSLRSDLNEVIRLWEDYQKTNSEDAKKRIAAKLSTIARVFPDPSRAQDHLKGLVKMLSDKKLLNLMKICLGSGQDCAKVTKAVSEVVVMFGAKSPMFETIKAILDRAALLLMDMSAAKELVMLVTRYVDNEVFEDDVTNEEDSLKDDVSARGRKALSLLLICVTVYPWLFKFPLIFEHLLMYLKKGEFLVDFTLQILTHIGRSLEDVDSTLFSHYQPTLSKLFVKGKPSQIKLAGRIVSMAYPNSSTIFQRILESRLESLDYGSSSILTTLACISEIALQAPKECERHIIAVIRDFLVKDILMKDRGRNPKSGPNWCDEDDLSKEVKAKIFGLKILVNWLRGSPNSDKTRSRPVFAMLNKTIVTKGDLNGGGRLRSCEMSHLTLAAACGLLKLAQVSSYNDYLDVEYFQNLTSIVKDASCTQVRLKFAKKLSKGLDSLKLPLEYLALFAFYAKESNKDLKQQAKQMILRNIQLRNEYIRQHRTATEHAASMLPEYALPYLIYMLSHLPNGDYSASDFLKEIKTYLWFFMECILARGDNYNFTKKLAENIKQTKDANAEGDESANHAIYAVCDIVIGIVMDLSKTRTFLLKDYSADIVLPKKMYTPLGKGKGNNKSYLPKGFVITPVKKTTGGAAASRITPSKGVGNASSSSTDKKKIVSDKPSLRVTGKSTRSKKIQKSLLSMMGKKDEEDNEDISDDEQIDKTTEAFETVEPPNEEITDVNLHEKEEKEAKFTKVSPRKKLTPSTAKEEITRESTRLPSKESTVSAPVSLKRKPAPDKPRLSASAASEKGVKKPSKAMMKPTRFSPRNQKNANTRRGDLDEVKRTLEEDYSEFPLKTPIDKREKDSLGEGNASSHSDGDGQTSNIIPSPTKSPAKKRKIDEESSQPRGQSSLVIKRRRKKR